MCRFVRAESEYEPEGREFESLRAVVFSNLAEVVESGLLCCVRRLEKVFELTHGSQSETVLYNFTGGKDGGEPVAGVIFDKAENLYSTASVGGALGWGCSVFQVRPVSNNKQTE